MKFRFMLKGALVAGVLLGLSTSAFAADKKKVPTMTGASADMLANTCNGCHGPEGASRGPASPTIAGISKDYFIETMQGFASGEIPSTIMGRIAKGYSEDELEAMAEHFSKEKFVPAKQHADMKLAKKGAKLHDKYCEKCHADGGTSAEDDAGILAGQWTPYLEMSLSDFLKGDRQAPKKMAKKLKKLHKKKGDAGIRALIAYYASQK